jgi:hypothetical protein
MRGFRNGAIYKILGRNISNGCNNFVVLEGGNEEEITPNISGEKIIIWNQTLVHIREKGLRVLHGKGMVEGFLFTGTLVFYFCECFRYGK